jgi:hypothetical protein
MRIQAKHTAGLLDISHRGIAEGKNYLPPLNVVLKPDEIISVPDMYRGVESIDTAISRGLLLLLDYDTTRKGDLAVEDELGGVGGSALLVRVSHIDEAAGTVFFKVYDDARYQIEVYKYTRKEIGSHIHKPVWPVVYTDHVGKRYKVLYQLARSSLSWTMPVRWIRNERKNYFKFGFFDIATKARSPLSPLTVSTAVNGQGGTKILLQG